jgi:hypothetical protein
MFNPQSFASRVFFAGKRIVAVVLWMVLVFLMMSLLLVACTPGAASTVVNSL